MSKTDPFRMGVTIFLGKTDSDTCPAAALLSYLAKRGLAPGPLFRFDDGRPLTRLALVSEVRAALTVAGIEPAPYSGHSFRIGAATSAAAAGIEDAVIKTLGRWRSDAYQTYVKLPREALRTTGSPMTVVVMLYRLLSVQSHLTIVMHFYPMNSGLCGGRVRRRGRVVPILYIRVLGGRAVTWE